MTIDEVTATRTPLWRRGLAEFLGTCLLVTIIVGSGIAAERLSIDPGVQLLENSLATALGLGVVILLFAPISGAHLNPVISVVGFALGRRAGGGLTALALGVYTAMQVAGAVTGAALANAMFEVPTTLAATQRASPGTVLGEIVATAGLVLLVTGLSRSNRSIAAIAAAVGAYIGAAYWFTSSTAFANPAVTLGRIFTDTFAGISPPSAALYVAGQIAGAVLGAALSTALLPLHRRPEATTSRRI